MKATQNPVQEEYGAYHHIFLHSMVEKLGKAGKLIVTPGGVSVVEYNHYPIIGERNCLNQHLFHAHYDPLNI